MKNKKEKTEVDLMFERFTDNITVGDPTDMIQYDFANDPWIKARIEEIAEFIRNHPLPKDLTKGSNMKSD